MTTPSMSAASLTALLATATVPHSWADRLKAGELHPWIAPGLAIAGILLGLAIITMQIRTDRRHRTARRASAATSTTTPPAAATPAQTHRKEAPLAAADPTPLREVMRDAEELMDRLAARTEARADRLEALIAQATQAQQRLADLAADAAARVAQPPAPPGPTGGPAAAIEPKPRAKTVTDDRYQNIYQLADQGLSAPQIAKRLDQPTGEIELILSLRKV